MKIGIVVGTRPNFVKAAALVSALNRCGVQPVLIHTGQHRDAHLSDAFFARLALPEPDLHLGVGQGSRGQQFGEIVAKLSRVLPDLALDDLVVVGDVTSTAAGAVAADACDVRLSHVEAGLRSFDLTMPEERNRRLVDAVAQRHFVSEPSGIDNLRREGHDALHVHLVGNVMIDTLLRFRDEALAARVWERHGLGPREYALVTLHRPANVDSAPVLSECVDCLREIAGRVPVLFAVHPRTSQRLLAFGLTLPDRVRLLPPQDYLDFIGLMAGAFAVVTDSGGAQEETTVLNVPCLTMRENTERPITVTHGTSRLVGRSVSRMRSALSQLASAPVAARPAVPLWDGRAGDRIADILLAG